MLYQLSYITQSVLVNLFPKSKSNIKFGQTVQYPCISHLGDLSKDTTCNSKKDKKPNLTPLRPSLHPLKQRVSLTVKNILVFILKSLLPL